MNTPTKSWVLVRFSDGRTEAWRDYDDNFWGSPVYTILGYFEGSHRAALVWGRSLTEPTL